ncbi:RNA polymerase sigma factor [Streptosporangium sandarakinum]|uniref:RNA polymerase sigma factor n=1 Tax=Streptosporangium sandarakinum TaxID=1260955 RepID=UPI003D8D2F4C
MDNGVLVEALRGREPGALAALYDFHAPGLYQYCWFMLGGPDGAQVALRDTMITAEARVHELADPGLLRAWLYALARGECVRRRPAAGPEPGMPGPAAPATEAARPGSPRSGAPAPASPGDGVASAFPGDGAIGLAASAWHAVRSLSPQDQEVLELLHRHGLSVADLARVLGVPVRRAGAMDDAARERLRDAITVEVLAHRNHHDCADLARSLDGPPGRLTPQARRRAARHVSGCDACAPHRARQVSASKVLAVLPPVVPPGTLRVRVMSCFTDPDLVPYRRYVARRAGLLDAAGFPRRPDHRKGRGARVVAGAVAALAATAAVAVMSVQFIGEFGEDAAGAPETRPVTGEPLGTLLPRTPGPAGPPAVLRSLGGREAARPAGSGPPRPIVPIAFTGPGERTTGTSGVPFRSPCRHRTPPRPPPRATSPPPRPRPDPPRHPPHGPPGPGPQAEARPAARSSGPVATTAVTAVTAVTGMEALMAPADSVVPVTPTGGPAPTGPVRPRPRSVLRGAMCRGSITREGITARTGPTGPVRPAPGPPRPPRISPPCPRGRSGPPLLRSGSVPRPRRAPLNAPAVPATPTGGPPARRIDHGA